MDRVSQAREQIWQAIVEAGGPYRVARAARIHVTHLYSWRKRTRSLGEDLVERLRAELPGVEDAVWGAALAPAPAPSAEANP